MRIGHPPIATKGYISHIVNTVKIVSLNIKMQQQIFLSILIPTYNRPIELSKNLYIIDSIFQGNNFNNEIEIIISDNCSNDDCRTSLNKFDFDDLNYTLFIQEQNIGALNNCLFLLSKANGKFIMYLGDDDYLDTEYLNKIIPVLKKDESLHCVIPATKSLYPSGEITPGRDYGKKSKIFDKGFKNCLENSWRGTQLSAIICRREGLYETYLKQQVNNLYPFIYFISFNCLRGKTWHMTEYPVTITQMERSNHVDYGLANLVPDIYDNYKKLTGISYLQRASLEIKVLKEQPWRYLEYLKTRGLIGLANFLNTVFQDKSTTFITKLLLPFIILKEIVYRIVLETVKFFKSSGH